MKLTKKKVFVAALAVCLIAILSLGTLAWFNASDDITNKFLIADSDGDGTPDFSVEVWENENDNDDNADADGDGEITNSDLTLLVRHMAGWGESEVSLIVADVNYDGILNNRDIIALIQKLAWGK